MEREAKLIDDGKKELTFEITGPWLYATCIVQAV